MAVDPERAAGTLVYEGVEYRFCSLECAGKFADEPDRYVVSPHRTSQI
jgi:YHS domain-containing protein